MQEPSIAEETQPLIEQRLPLSYRIRAGMFAPVDITSLVVFRIGFGACMVWHATKTCLSDALHADYVAPAFHFKYAGFEWVEPWTGIGMSLHFVALGTLAACIMFGMFYRVCMPLFAVGYAYSFLMEKADYQNHYYLITLISCILVFLPAHRAYSFDACRSPSLRRQTTPAWTVWILRAQIGIPYFYGGIAKCNLDWLQGQPMSHWLLGKTGIPFIGPFFAEEWVGLSMSYGGLLLDLLIVPFLLWRRTRIYAYLLTIAFHLMNSVMFSIGIFPWMMIAASLIFFPPDWPRRIRLLPKLHAPLTGTKRKPAAMSGSNLTVALLIVYLTFQLFWPLRCHLYAGNPSWTEEGHRFAWRMMLRDKRSSVGFLVVDPTTGKSAVVDPRPYLSSHQLRRMMRDPELIAQFCRFLKTQVNNMSRRDAEVYATVWASLNGRRPQRLIDPQVDLASFRPTWRPAPWIVPLHEPLRKDYWPMDPNKWPKDKITVAPVQREVRAGP